MCNEITELEQHLLPLQRYVRFRIHHPQDAEDIIQEVCLAAAKSHPSLPTPEAYKAWLIGIARHKCDDYYRNHAREQQHLTLMQQALRCHTGRMGITIVKNAVHDTLQRLSPDDQQILHLYYFRSMPQREIATQLSLPLGTVKSRLHYAKKAFRHLYPYPTKHRGASNMKTKLPETIPTYTITPSDLPPFSVRWEELQGWQLVPRIGESLTWGLYDAQTGMRTEYTEMRVLGEAEIHGIRGVEISAIQYDAENYYRTGSVDRMERRFVAQLTDTHCRYLAESHVDNGVRKLYTFLDGEAFLDNWGFGENNCGNEVHLAPRNLLQRQGNVITGETATETVDIVGRYALTLAGKRYDTICVMDIHCFNDCVASEQYLDENGRTVLWRRFNKNDWGYDRYGKLWSEMLPENERLMINGALYVHWYDCLSDYVL